MGNSFINLPVPGADGAGAAVDVSTLGSMKSIVVGVTAGPSGEGMRCTLNVQVSNAAAAPVNDNEWAAVATFQQDFGGDITLALSAKWLRVVRSSSKSPAGTPSCTVGGTDDGTTIANLPVTGGNGSGAGVDVHTLPPYKTVTVGGTWNGNINIELSEDGVFFAPEISFLGGGGAQQQSATFVAKFMRVTRDGVPTVAPGLPIVNVGGANVPGGGGGGSGGTPFQDFVYTATGAEGTDFRVTLPAARALLNYFILSQLSGVNALVAIDLPTGVGDRTLTDFRVITSANLTAGDKIEFSVFDP